MKLTEEEMAAFKEAQANVGTETKKIQAGISELLT
jgi:hypothetical protein